MASSARSLNTSGTLGINVPTPNLLNTPRTPTVIIPPSNTSRTPGISIPTPNLLNTPRTPTVIIPPSNTSGTLGINVPTPNRTNTPRTPGINISYPSIPTELINSTKPITSKLTIYSKSGHIVQQYSSDVKSVILPKSTEISSITVIDANGNIIPFSYIPETTLGLSLTNPVTGEKVYAKVIKDGQEINGKVLSLDSQNVTLMADGKLINIRKYDQVQVNIDDNVTRPRLILNTPNLFTVSYLLSNISWSCVGTALIDKNTMYLRLSGNITNNTETDINAEVTLVSGDVFQNRTETYAPKAMMMASSQIREPMRSDKVDKVMLEDYVRYDVGNKIIHNKDVAELGTWNFPFIKIYTHKIADDDVKFGYRFTTPDYLPECEINVYSINSNKQIDAYLGTNQIEESQKGEEKDLMLGTSTVIKCKSSVIISNDVIIDNERTAQQYNMTLNEYRAAIVETRDNSGKIVRTGGWHIVTENITVEITNNNIEVSFLIIKHYVGDKLLIDTQCRAYKKREQGYIEWYFEVPPKVGTNPFKDTFQCNVLTASYY